MKKPLIITSILLLSASLIVAQTIPEPGGEKAKDPAMVDVPDQPGLPRVLLIGDSISLGYTIPVRALLKDKANIHRPNVNSGPTNQGLESLDAWLTQGTAPGEAPKKWDVIHFNFGLHDTKIMGPGPDGGIRQVPPDQYEKNLRTIVARLKATGAKVIWATTTPVPDGKLRPMRFEADVVKYNEIAAKVMADNNIPTDDLFALVLPNEQKIQVKNNVHYLKAGYQMLAKQVAESIPKALSGQ